MRNWEANIEGAVEGGPDQGEGDPRADREAVVQGGHLKLCCILGYFQDILHNLSKRGKMSIEKDID